VPNFGDRFLANFPFKPRGAYMTHGIINTYIHINTLYMLFRCQYLPL